MRGCDVWLLRMVSMHRVVRSLPGHSEPASIRRWHRLLVSREDQVRRPNLRAAVVRSRCSVRRLWGLNRSHRVPAGHERLRLGVERMIPVIASRYGMLALWIARVCMGWQLSERIRDAVVVQRSGRAWWSRRPSRNRWPTRLIRRRAETGLPVLLRSSWRYWRTICRHWATAWLKTLRGVLGSILQCFISLHAVCEWGACYSLAEPEA